MQPHDFLFALMFWVIAIYLCRPSSWRREDWRDRRVLGSRVFAICMAISLTIQAHPIGVNLDSAIGLNNVSWMLGYMNAVVGIYAGTSSIVSIRNKSLPLWLSLVSVGTIAVFTLLFPWLIATGEEFHNELPHSLPLLVLREALYVYIFIIALYCLRMFRLWIVGEVHPAGRLRGSILIFAFSSVVVFAVLRGLAAFVVFMYPTWEGYAVALKTSDAMLILTITAVVLGVAPAAWLRTPVRIINYTEQHRALRDLERIRSTLVGITGEVPWVQPAYRDRWFNLPFVLYCACIDILDRRVLLQSKMKETHGAITRDDTRVAGLLDQLPDTPDWIELVQHLRQVARQI